MRVCLKFKGGVELNTFLFLINAVKFYVQFLLHCEVYLCYHCDIPFCEQIIRLYAHDIC